MDLKVLGLLEEGENNVIERRIRDIHKIVNTQYEDLNEKIYSVYWVYNAFKEMGAIVDNMDIEENIKAKIVANVKRNEANGAFGLKDNSSLGIDSTYYTVFILKSLY